MVMIAERGNEMLGNSNVILLTNEANNERSENKTNQWLENILICEKVETVEIN